MTKPISFGYALDRACLKVAMAVIEPLPRIGINNIVIYNIFDKGYNVITFVDQLSKIINGPHGKINVMITLDSAPFNELTEAKINSLPSKYRGACKYINRFAPDIAGRFITVVDDLIDLLFSHNLMPYISWQLWQEPNSMKYFHGSFFDFKFWTNIKKGLLMRTDRPICSFGATASLITDPLKKGQVEWFQHYQDAPVFSTSFYWLNSAGFFNPNDNWLPPNYETIITAYNVSSNGKQDRLLTNSHVWMTYITDLLAWIKEKNININTIYFWNLLDCSDRDNKGAHAAWAKTNDGYVQNPVWKMQMDLCEVLLHPDGVMRYDVTPNGISGYQKKIVIVPEGYGIENK